MTVLPEQGLFPVFAPKFQARSPIGNNVTRIGLVKEETQRRKSRMKISKQVLEEAHDASFQNRRILEKSKKCACFFCNNIFSPAEIEEWCHDRDGDTAVCPYCEIDSVIGDAAGYPLTEDFIIQMNLYWFGGSDKTGDGHKIEQVIIDC